MFFYLKQTLIDIKGNSFLHSVTIITISLSVLIVSAFCLFFVNANDIMSSWKHGVKIMAYMDKDIHKSRIEKIKKKISEMYGVQEVTYISRKKAMEILKEHMKHQPSILENFEGNPLPASFEISLKKGSHKWEGIENLAFQIQGIDPIDDVEYGQAWLGRFMSVFNLFRFAGLAMGGVFFMVTVFIIANTIRLALYSRRKEIEVMRLVGAEDIFIKAPFYIQGLIQGIIGGITGIILLFIPYLLFTMNMQDAIMSYIIELRFLSFKIILITIFCSTFVGWLGCYISVKQFMKT